MEQRRKIVGIIASSISQAGDGYDPLAWDIDNLPGSPDNQESIVGSPLDLFMTSDGATMYITDYQNKIHTVGLSTPWNISSFSVDATETIAINLEAIWFKEDGTKMYLGMIGSGEIKEYNLSTPWLVSSYSLVATSTASGAGRGSSMYISPDGTKLYIADDGTNLVYEHTLSNPWDVSSMSYIQSFNPTASVNRALFFKPEGDRMYTNGATGTRQFNLGTPWDLSTASFDIMVYTGGAYGMFWKPDGMKQYGVHSGVNESYEFHIS